MNENSAVYSVFGRLSPAATVVGLEYVWKWNSGGPHPGHWLYAFERRSDWPPNAVGAPLLVTTAWSYPWGKEGMSPGLALLQPLGHGVGCSLTDPVWKRGASKFVSTVSALATPHGSKAMLRSVASNPTNAVRGRFRRSRVLERHMTTPPQKTRSLRKSV